MIARPTVTVSYAQTLDGRLATRTGDSQWISGQPSLVLAHRLRTLHDAVLIDPTKQLLRQRAAGQHAGGECPSGEQHHG
jgi:hypothetical protein